MKFTRINLTGKEVKGFYFFQILKCNRMQEEKQRGITITQKQRPQLTLQERVLQKVKKFYLEGASIRNQTNSIKIHAFVLVDEDLEFFKSIEGMYTNIEIKRSGKGIVVILKFEP